MGESSEGDVCDRASGVSSVLLGRSDGTAIKPIAAGVGVTGGSAKSFGFRRFLGDGVAGGGMLVVPQFVVISKLTSESEIADEDDSLIERRSDIAGIVVLGIMVLNLESRVGSMQKCLHKEKYGH